MVNYIFKQKTPHDAIRTLALQILTPKTLAKFLLGNPNGTLNTGEVRELPIFDL